MKRNLSRQKLMNFGKMAVFYLLVYGVMLIPHYSADSFAYNVNPLQNNKGNLALGRVGDYIINQIIVKLGGNYVKQQILFVLILILTLAFVTNGLYKFFLNIFSRELVVSAKFVLKVILVLMFCNIFLMEWFIFVEMTFIWSLSLLFMYWAVIQVRDKFSIKQMIYSILLLTASVSFYQATIGFYIFFSLLAVYIANNGKLTKISFLNSVKVIICGAFGGGFNLGFIKIMQVMGLVSVTGRTEDMTLQMLLNNIKIILDNIKMWLFSAYGLLPKYTLLIFVIIVYVLVLIYFVREKYIFSDIIYFLLMVITCNGMVYFPHLMTSTVWMAQRTIASFLVLITLPVCVIVVREKKNLLLYLCSCLMLVLLGINVYKIQDIAVNMIASNRIDQEIAYLINDRIVKYDQEKDIKINNISICKDIYPTWGNKSIRYVCMDTNLRVFNVSHSGVHCINYYNETEYKAVDMPEEIYKKYFENKNWDMLNLDEQMVFEGDTVYLASY